MKKDLLTSARLIAPLTESVKRAQTVFGHLKHSIERLIFLLLKPLVILGEIESKSFPNFMVIRITFANLLHGNDFHCFLYVYQFVSAPSQHTTLDILEPN